MKTHLLWWWRCRILQVCLFFGHFWPRIPKFELSRAPQIRLSILTLKKWQKIFQNFFSPKNDFFRDFWPRKKTKFFTLKLHWKMGYFSFFRPKAGSYPEPEKKINLVRLSVCLFVCHQKSTPLFSLRKHVQNIVKVFVVIFCFKENPFFNLKLNKMFEQLNRCRKMLDDVLEVFSENSEFEERFTKKA